MELKYKDLIKKFSNVFNETKQKEKHFIIKALRDAGFSRSEVNLLDFKCGKFLWKSCLDSTKRNKG